jgi:cellulose synthase/poly-beta-1,6-N-acetylglucosamine synthase-like glycosyltransferase
LASILENLILLSYMVLILISLGMGKGLDNLKVQRTLISIAVILCGFNFFVIIYTLFGLFSSALTVLILIGFLFTYFVPPLLYDCKEFCMTLPKQLMSIVAYLLCMPLYLIIFQVYSYANFHDVSWGNREASADMTLQQV